MPISRLSIIESTLREGEQFAAARFTPLQRRQIAQALEAFGVEYIEVTTPVASAQAQRSCREIAALPLRATVLTHTRCVGDDVRLAIDCGVGGVDLLFRTTPMPGRGRRRGGRVHRRGAGRRAPGALQL
jgi:homocitrate synthase